MNGKMEKLLCLEDVVVSYRTGNLITEAVKGQTYDNYGEQRFITSDLGIVSLGRVATFEALFREVQTIEHAGYEWILHTGEERPIPGNWVIDWMLDSQDDDFGDPLFYECANGLMWSHVYAYRIVSTGNPDDKGSTDAGISNSLALKFGSCPVRKLKDYHLTFGHLIAADSVSEIVEDSKPLDKLKEEASSLGVEILDEGEPPSKPPHSALPPSCIEDINYNSNKLGGHWGGSHE